MDGIVVNDRRAHGAPEPLTAVPWSWTLACGLLKIGLAVAAMAPPLLVGHPLAPMVGWILPIGGLAELLLGWLGQRSLLRSLTLVSGGVTLTAGLLFLTSEISGLLQLSTIIATWLVARGIVSLEIGLRTYRTLATDWLWVTLRGITDLGLGVLLWVSIPISMMSLLAFGESPEIVTPFTSILSLSFAVAGIGLVVIAFGQRRQSSPPLL